MRIKKIDSVKNPKIKLFASLRERKVRKEYNLFLVEGERELKRALECGFIPKSILVLQNYEEKYKDVAEKYGAEEFIIISERCAEKISLRENPSYIFGVFEYPPSKNIEDAEIKEESVCLVLLGLEKPGNIGAILRTADAFSVDMVLIPENTDIFNPQIIRNSLGAVFALNIFQVSEEKILDFLKNFHVISADPKGDFVLWNTKIDFPVALIVGSEAHGIPEKFLSISKRIRIPMFGKSDSLNVSVACGIMLYEIAKTRAK